jgi:queuine tRNA-ribosyltransferase
MLGAMLLSEINIAYYQALMAEARTAIAGGRFAEFRAQAKAGWGNGDLPPR